MLRYSPDSPTGEKYMWQSWKCENPGMSPVIKPQMTRSGGVPALEREQGGAERQDPRDNSYIWFLASLEISLFTVTAMPTVSLHSFWEM